MARFRIFIWKWGSNRAVGSISRLGRAKHFKSTVSLKIKVYFMKMKRELTCLLQNLGGTLCLHSLLFSDRRHPPLQGNYQTPLTMTFVVDFHRTDNLESEEESKLA